MTLSNYAKKPLRLPKKVTLRDAKENIDKVRIYSKVQKTSENAGEKLYTSKLYLRLCLCEFINFY